MIQPHPMANPTLEKSATVARLSEAGIQRDTISIT